MGDHSLPYLYVQILYLHNSTRNTMITGGDRTLCTVILHATRLTFVNCIKVPPSVHVFTVAATVTQKSMKSETKQLLKYSVTGVLLVFALGLCNLWEMVVNSQGNGGKSDMPPVANISRILASVSKL